MGINSVVSIFGIIIGLLSLLFAIFLLTVKSENRLSNRFIAGYLLLLSFDLSVYYYAHFITLPPAIEMLRIKSSAFKSPLLFLYILTAINQDFKFKKIHLLNLLPFIIEIAVLFPRFFLVNAAEQKAFMSSYFTQPEAKFNAFFAYGVSVLYIIASYVVLKRYKKVILENYTTDFSLSNYRFLMQLLCLIMVGFSLTLIKEFLLFSASPEIISISRLVMLMFGIFFMCWLFLKALHAPNLFRGVTGDMKPIKEIVAEEKLQTLGSDGPKNKTEQKLSVLQAYMNENEPYLNASLTIKELAKELKWPERDLSILINHQLNQHFFDFINEYRIKKAMKLLRDPSYNKHTILEILYEVGFNSKTPFNTAFKKITKQTPSQYRKNH